MLWAKFQTQAERDAVVEAMRSQGQELQGKRFWANADMPLPERTIRSFVFAAKRVLVARGLRAVWADPENGTLTVGWDVVATATVARGKLIIKYGHDWEEHLQQDDAWTESLKVQESKLDKGGGKGCEKGKRQIPCQRQCHRCCFCLCSCHVVRAGSVGDRSREGEQ